MMRAAAIGAASLLVLLARPGVARADDDPVQSLRVATTVIATANPFIAVPIVQLAYRHQMYENASPLFRNFFEASAEIALGQFFAPRVRLSLHPARFFEAGVSYGASIVYLKAIEERRSPSDSYDVRVLGYPAADAATFQSFAVDTTLQGAFGDLLFRSTNTVTYTDGSLAAGETVYYSAIADMLLPAQSWVFGDETTLAYALSPDLRLGVTETLFATSYPASAYAPGQSHAAVTNTPVVRVGPSFSMTLRDQGDGAFARVDVFGVVQWYARDRYRTGESISGAVPFISLGLRFGGALWRR